MSRGKKDILWFKEISKKDVALVGGKGANLGEMFQAKFPIPAGFCVSAGTYKKFIESTGIDKKIYKVLKDLNVDDTGKLHEAADKVQNIILDTEITPNIKGEVQKAYDNLNVDIDVFKVAGKKALDIIKAGRDIPFVAVRSSATAEDLPEASFAGQQSTFLNVRGKEDLISAVQKCWASLFTARAIYYRVKNNFPHEQVFISVIVQKMVNAEKAGVIFSINPATNENEVLIEAGLGLGETVVSGAITPDKYLIDKKTYEIKDKKISIQNFQIIKDINLGRNVKKQLTDEQGGSQKLTDVEIKNLAKIAVDIEAHYKSPQDIEFAIESGRIYIVQSRPVTTMKKIEKAKTEIKEFEHGVELVKGYAASPLVGTGAVKIVKEVSDLNKIEKGDVLVAEMTNPDYVPAMKKASAIVTEKGGLTCFGEDTIVLTDKGFLKIKDVTERINSGEGFSIFSFDYSNYKPKWKRILSASTRKREAIRISTSQTNKIEHNTLDITSDHKMFTFDGRKLIKKELNNILDNQEALCLVGKLPQNIVETRNDKLAYLMGSLLSDGCVRVINHHTGNPRRGSVVFTQKQVPEKFEFINTVQECFKEVFNEEFSLIREKTSNSQIRGRQITGTVTDFICSKLAPAQSILEISQNLDSWVMNLSEISSLNFLAGLVDGDGSFYENRLHLYVGKENVLQGVVLACLKLGIVPQITVNRNIHHVQILERMQDILGFCKRLSGDVNLKINGTKLFSAKQILGDIVDKVNKGGKIKPYIMNNLLIDCEKIRERILPLIDGEVKNDLMKIVNSDLRMHRTKKISDIGLIDVYNLQVEAENELEHNYVVFTKKYTPLLVSNSHAAIVGREMGLAVVVGAAEAMTKLKEGDVVTVDGSKGIVYAGKVEIETKQEKVKEEQKEELKELGVKEGEKADPVTEIKVIVDLPDLAEKAAATSAEGVGLLRCEFMMLHKNKEHPVHMIDSGRKDELVDRLADDIMIIAKAFKNKPVWYRTLDAPTDEFRQLEGGEDEPHEDNPMMGWRSIRRGLDQPQLLKSQFEAIKKVHDAGYTNVGVMLPLVSSVEQIRKAKELMTDVGLEPLEEIEFGIMVETPASVQIIEDICKEGIDFVSIGSNDLTQFTLAVDRNNAKLQGMYDEMHLSVLKQIKEVVRVCKENNVETSICGQAGSRPEMAEFLVKCGIDSISANIDAVEQIRRTVYITEKKMLLKVAREKS